METKTCCHCDQPIYSRQMCKAHYQRWWRTGSAESDGYVTYTRVRNGKTQTVRRRVRSTERGYGRTPLYRAWVAMVRRCSEPLAHNYQWYGGKGVTVCVEWQDFLVFRDWAEQHGYARGMELDRIDKDGPYSPENCRYLTKRTNIDRKGRNVPTVTLTRETFQNLDRVAGEESLDSLADRIITEWLEQHGSRLRQCEGGEEVVVQR